MNGTVFSGAGDGFRQMMPFQMYLYEHLSSFSSLYDASFGLGGDYMKGTIILLFAVTFNVAKFSIH